jgi:hypothetical protein
MTRAALVALVLVAGTALAEPPATPSEALRTGNAAATAGDWGTVARVVDPLLEGQLPQPDLAEAHRLAGLAAFFLGHREQAERHFLAYLRIDLDAQLDPALYPVEAIIFFNDVKAKHAAELRARRPKGKRYWVLNLLPPWGQFQNGDRTKGFVVGGMLAAFAASTGTSFFMLRSWCTEVSGDSGSSLTCDDGGDHYGSANTARVVYVTSMVGLGLTYAYGVIDGARGYRRRTRESAIQPFVSTTSTSSVIGVAGSF